MSVVGQLAARALRAGSGAPSCGPGGPRRRTRSRWSPAGQAPGRGCPVSSSTSRTAALLGGLARPRRGPWAATRPAVRAGRSRAIRAARASPSVRSTTRPPAEVSSTVRRRRGWPPVGCPLRCSAIAASVDTAARRARAARCVPCLPCRPSGEPRTARRSAVRLTTPSGSPCRSCSRVAPVARRARRAVRGSRSPARAGRRLGARRAARRPGRRPRLHHRRPARRWSSELLSGWARRRAGTSGIAFGTVGARKGDYVIEITTYRVGGLRPRRRASPR